MHRRQKFIGALALAIVISAPAPSWPASRHSAHHESERCRALSASILSSVKTIASLKAADLVDESAPRATMRAAQISNEQNSIQMNITMLADTRCAAYDGPLSPDDFLVPAAECQLQLMKQLTAHRRAFNDAVVRGKADASEHWTYASTHSPEADEADAAVLKACEMSNWQVEK